MSWNWLTSLRDAGCEVVGFTQPKYQPDFRAEGRDSIVHEGVELNFVPLPQATRFTLPHRVELLRTYVGWQQNMLVFLWLWVHF